METVPRLKRVKMDLNVSGEDGSSKKSFRWTPNIQDNVAKYVRDNFQQFKTMRRIDFLRKLRDSFGLVNCDDKQLKNGFQAFLKKYHDVKQSLNSSGFGVDLEIDKSLDKGWVLKKCPYFEILDEVMATRPNVSPPCVIESNSFGEVRLSSDPLDFDVEDDIKCSRELIVNAFDVSDLRDVRILACNSQEINTTKISDAHSSTRIPFTKPTVPPQNRAIGNSNPKTALGAFAKIMGDRMTEQKEVELKKLKIDSDKFEYKKEFDDRMLKVEITKINKEAEVSLRKLEIERELELKKIEDQGEQREFELKKLELQIKLEQAKSTYQTSQI